MRCSTMRRFLNHSHRRQSHPCPIPPLNFIKKTGETSGKITPTSFLLVLQKARLARIRIAKASSGAAFVSKKKAAEARLAAQQSGLQLDDYKEEDIFELQHHHLLRCLEKTTVSSVRNLVTAARRPSRRNTNSPRFYLARSWKKKETL